MPDPTRTPTPDTGTGTERGARFTGSACEEQSAHDALADLFLGGSRSRSFETEPAANGADAAGTRGAGFRIEVVRTPQLGSREPALLRRHAAGVAAEIGRPVLLLMLGRHTVSAEAVRAGGAAGVGPGLTARARSLEALLAGARERYGAVLVHDGRADGASPAAAGADAITVLFEGDRAGSAAWAFRSLRSAKDASKGPVALRAGDLSAASGTRAAPVDRLRGAAGGALGFEVEGIEPLAGAFSGGLVYRGTVATRPEDAIDAIRRGGAASRTGSRARSAETASGGGAEAEAARALVPEGLRGVRPVAARCPKAASIEVGVDDTGGVHLIGREAGSLAALLCAERWVTSRPAELVRAARAVRFDRPTLHVLTLDERTPALLSGTRVRVHAIRPCWPD